MTDVRVQRTKIVATLGPASMDGAVLERMVRAGMTVARINFAHGDHDEHAQQLERVRRAATRAGHSLAVLGDLAGPKLRVGEMRDGKVPLETGRVVVLTSRPILGTAAELPVAEASWFRDVKRGDPVFLADGTLELRVEHSGPTEVTCRIINGGLLLSRKGINLPNTRLRLPALTRKDESDLRHAARVGFDALALSFVRSVQDIHLAKRRIGRAAIPLIAKIEKREAIQHLRPILQAADGAMVARGDLGVETSVDEVPLLQKQIIRLANQLGKPVVTATQMLKSMVEAPHPTRAEAADVANAILDGTDAVMLSEETAMGRYPVQTVETMARIARRAETAIDHDAFLDRARETPYVAIEVSDAAVRVARSLNAVAIVTPTAQGATPRFVARLRPVMPVLGLTRHAATARFLNFSWGVQPVHTPNLGNLEATLRYGLNYLKRLGWAKSGQRVVFTAGFPPDGQASNLMTVQVVR